MADRLIFFNIPVADVARSRAFYGPLGFTFNDGFSDENTACMVVNESAFFMLLQTEKFKAFAPRDIVDPAAGTAHLLTFSAESREEVDTLVDAALAAGATKANDPEDHGFMYGRSFHDLDGHYWSVMWMDPAVAAAGVHE